MWKKVALRFLGTSFFVCSVAVMGVTFVSVTSVRADEPPCPSSCDSGLACPGSLCTCKQTGVGTGVWACYQPGDPD